MCVLVIYYFFFNDTSTTEIYTYGHTLSLHDALPIFKKLQEVIDLLNVEVVSLTDHPGQYLDKFVAEDFDRILLDAQCSGEGMTDFGRSSALRYWSLERVEQMSRLQPRMLVAAFQRIRPGGVLVFSPCPLAPGETKAPV